MSSARTARTTPTAAQAQLSNTVEIAVKALQDKVVDLCKDKWIKLAISVIIDIIGLMSFLIPILAEVIDLAWAPISAVLLYQLYGNSILSGVALLEEALPFTDIIPTATIGWLCEHTQLGPTIGLNIQDAPLRPNPKVEHIQ